MKKILVITGMMFGALAYSQEAPKVLKTSFSASALSQKVQTIDGKKVTIKDVLAKHKGKILVLDMWASWCRDCINALPAARTLKNNNPNVDFVFLSLDRSEEAWKKGLDKHELANKENYWFFSGWKNDFNNYIDLNWIPRYIVINQKSDIAKYYAITPDDPDIQKTINELSK
ncbi:thioredoxin-like domain-containing protein [Riemerella anatipestifer]|uniref:TlpA family protein disulfide reductase n=1 Tax=Riemerella anatipestifer TaxID=34085 RepID=UPI002A89BAAA|nr:thioredoxin-like domain-containing protein [Riemerella anatipestifer]